MNINQNNPIPQSNQESSSYFTYAPLNSSKTNEIPDQHHINNYHGLIQQEQIEVHREIRETNNPDPDPADPLTRTPPFPHPAPLVRYRECLKNHAANMGSHVLDGCGEFMANGEGTPEALKCAACECHRSFHRREEEGESQSTTRTNNAMVVHNPLPRTTVMQPHHHNRYNMPPMMVAFGATGVTPTESSSEEMDMFQTRGTHGGQPPSKKRFRTKITEEQKEKMHEFAEKIGWKIQKPCEQEIQQFCNEVGLKRKVFKVWMHNTKQASKKKQE